MPIDWNRLDYLQGAQEDDPAFRSLSAYVPGEGDNPIAMIIGELPSAQDVIRRRPFVDAAGSVLRDLMELAGLSADPTNTVPEDGWQPNCWLTHVIKFRPPIRNGTRKPTPEEVTAARPYLRQEWVAVGRPRIIIPVGEVAFRAVTGKPASILRAAGKLWPPIISNDDGAPLFVWPMVHPAFGLRTPAVQPLIEKDWEILAVWMREHAPN